jgi:hypothetical protein
MPKFHHALSFVMLRSGCLSKWTERLAHPAHAACCTRCAPLHRPHRSLRAPLLAPACADSPRLLGRLAKPPPPCQFSTPLAHVALKAYVVNICVKCFRCSRYMLQVFHMDVTKVDLDVAYVVMAILACRKCLFKMFHLL